MTIEGASFVRARMRPFFLEIPMAEPHTLKESWHVSKAVPVTLIIALLIQAAAVIWQGSQWTAAISANTRDIEVLRAAQASMARDSQAQAVQLARIEENTRYTAERISELVRQLERDAQ